MSASSDTTYISIPTPIYRRLKALSALKGRRIPDLAGALIDACVADLLAREFEGVTPPHPDQMDLIDAIEKAAASAE